MPKIPKIPKIPTLIRNDAQKPLKTHSCPIDVLVLFYACADSSKWGLFGRCARSAFRRTPSGPEICSMLALDSSKWGLFGRCARSAFRRTPSGSETAGISSVYLRLVVTE